MFAFFLFCFWNIDTFINVLKNLFNFLIISSVTLLIIKKIVQIITSFAVEQKSNLRAQKKPKKRADDKILFSNSNLNETLQKLFLPTYVPYFVECQKKSRLICNIFFVNQREAKIIDESKVLLNEKQYQLIQCDDVQAFCKLPVQGYLLSDITIEKLENCLELGKLYNNKDYIIPKDKYIESHLMRVFFPLRMESITSLRQIVVVISPALAPEHTLQISEQLKLQLQLLLKSEHFRNKTSVNLFLKTTFNYQSTDSDDYTALLIEGVDCYHTIVNNIGCLTYPKINERHKWTAKFENKYRWFVVENMEDWNKCCSNDVFQTIPMERTLAIIKPNAMTSMDHIISDFILKYGFVIISQKKLHLNKQFAEDFYEYEERSKQATTKIGTICVLVLEKIGAIQAWRTLLGPTNIEIARKESPGSIRSKFGQTNTQNACHGSDSAKSAHREIKFFFPELTNDFEKAAPTIVEQYMQQKLANGETLEDFLVRGLSELAREKPGSGLEVINWFGNWLLTNNPNRPIIEED
ncbi:nucleoside diphosphate kinase [Reticulomyxa filosa]|uniref:Nucleoside diphosphate kinase n=1 Tax=Reticulomyxa filosa TaxID=46433 RepID=X6MRS2_RETFI|nr:nucleoside diphosphate kinase [Reticulomyxa filosa]|eukprot:ETO16351.1 nucleoside diphosphate kinase [Reticulomyxa filosa]